MTELGLNIAQKLKKARVSKGLAQKYVAEKIGITESKLGHYENGRAEPDINTLFKLSRFYVVSLDEWLNLSELNDYWIVTQKDEIDILKKYRMLPDPAKEDLKDYLNMKFEKYC